MGGFKRFYFILYFILSFIGVGFLMVVWMGLEPMATWLAPLENTTWFFWLMVLCVCVCVLGLIVVLCRAIFTPSDKRNLVMGTDLGEYRVSRDALRELITNTISHHSDLDCIDVRVKVDDKDLSTARVTAEVGVPQSAVLGILGPQLQREVKYAFESFTGGKTGDIVLVFSDVKDTGTPALPAPEGDLTNPPVSQLTSGSEVTSASAETPEGKTKVTLAQRRAAAAERKATKKAAAKAEQEAAIAAATSDTEPVSKPAPTPKPKVEVTDEPEVSPRSPEMDADTPAETPTPKKAPAKKTTRSTAKKPVEAAPAKAVISEDETDHEDGPRRPDRDGDD